MYAGSIPAGASSLVTHAYGRSGRKSENMTDKDYLKRAITLSEQSPEPVGCGVVIAVGGKVIAETHNSQRADNCAVYHAEIKAIMAANKATGQRKLPGTTAYCSCEPCAMCLTALSYANIERIVFNMRMADLFPDDPQSQLDCYEFAKTLNFVPKIERLVV
ncbi:MAG TPA: nucleoside deaminase [Patescibacteria group bacterium]|nr:nucleoside deaminase [Patescibacteria group bacterium]